MSARDLATTVAALLFVMTPAAILVAALFR